MFVYEAFLEADSMLTLDDAAVDAGTMLLCMSDLSLYIHVAQQKQQRQRTHKRKVTMVCTGL